jgi:hypothetical protein
MFKRQKRCRGKVVVSRKLEIKIDFVNVSLSREADADLLETIPDDCLTDAGCVRMDISVEFLKRLHGLEDKRG